MASRQTFYALVVFDKARRLMIIVVSRVPIIASQTQLRYLDGNLRVNGFVESERFLPQQFHRYFRNYAPHFRKDTAACN